MEGPPMQTNVSSVPSVEEVPTLEKENYKTWKHKMERLLRNKGLWGYVDGTISEAENTYFKRAEFKSLFRNKCGAKTKPYIEGFEDYTFIWKQLVTMYEHTHPTNTGVQMRSSNYTWCVPFYNAIVGGKWETVKKFLLRNEGALTARITSEGEIPLHVAVQKGQVKVAQELIKMMPKEYLSLQGKFRRTALHIAAASDLKGNIDIVRALVEKNPELVMIESEHYDDSIPITVAARTGIKDRDVVYFLYRFTMDEEVKKIEDFDTVWRRATILTSLIFGDFHDLALDLLLRYPKSLVLAEDFDQVTAMDALASKPSAFRSSFPPTTSGLGMFVYYIQKFMYSWLDVHLHAKNAWRHTSGDVENFNDSNGDSSEVPGCKYIYEEKLKHDGASKLLKEVWRQVSELEDLGDVEDVLVKAMFQAIQVGIVEFIKEMIENCPQLISQLCKDEGYEEQTIFHYAISHRQKQIFSLIHDLGPKKKDLVMLADRKKNLMTHLAAIQAPPHRLNEVPGAALQLQRELLWYKDVDDIMPPLRKEFKNSESKTPKMIFTNDHKELVEKGATWMKDTATQCMVVATLVTTIMFASVLTIPGLENCYTLVSPAPAAMPKSNADVYPAILMAINNTLVKECDSHIQGKFPTMFFISNILALCSSVASMLMFLAIITSRFAEKDFMKTLPRMMMLGIFFLFLSIVGLMIAFVAAVMVQLSNNNLWNFSYLMLIVAGFPIITYAVVELPLFRELMFGTTWSTGKKHSGE